MGQLQSDVLTVYCRSCNKDVKVKDFSESLYVELKPNGERQFHLKEDCDVV